MVAKENKEAKLDSDTNVATNLRAALLGDLRPSRASPKQSPADVVLQRGVQASSSRNTTSGQSAAQPMKTPLSTGLKQILDNFGEENDPVEIPKTKRVTSKPTSSTSSSNRQSETNSPTAKAKSESSSIVLHTPKPLSRLLRQLQM